MNHNKIPVVIIGAGGYVGAEFIRLISTHPSVSLRVATSDSLAGQRVDNVMPHLRGAVGNLTFTRIDTVGAFIQSVARCVLLSAAPHGGAATVIDECMTIAENNGCALTVVDASADFRYHDAGAYEAVYGQPHGAPHRLDAFQSAVPELYEASDAEHIGHPGCFATAQQLGIAPLLASNVVEPRFFTNGITGATGAGKTPLATTHTPERHSNLFAYKSLSHRHAPEVVQQLSDATGKKPQVHFTPHSGPFARGIHMTINAIANTRITDASLKAIFEDTYRDAPFVRIVDGMPRLKSVVGSNFADIGVTTDGDAVTVCVVIDNLLKGAAGGSVQWMNRLLGFDETEGLLQASIGWT
ncbi:MAG: N-acetyl-gamma-glutamyl-phosphate reductase [Pseudomonadota bacterium]